jgi:membrane fusion protein, multidrug efflux system
MFKVKKLSYTHIFLFSLLSFVGCSDSAEETPEAIRQQISQYNAQINELTMKIKDLELLLGDMGERPQSRNQIPVTVTELKKNDFKQFFQAASSVEAIQSAIISPETSGQMKELLVKKGQHVKAGQVVARLNTSVIAGTIAEVETSLALARTVYNRQKSLWDQQIGSEIQYLEAHNNLAALETRLKTLQSQLEMAVMRAPFDGIVDDVFIKEGELAMPGSKVLLLLNLHKLYINADISESHLGAIRKGDPVILRFPSYPGFEASVPIHRIGNTINPENRTFRIQLQIDNPGERFKPNMMANISINILTMEDVISIPSILIKQDLQGHYVYVASQHNDDLVARKIYIERGPDGKDITMITSGLKAGDLIINRGHNQVTDMSLIHTRNSQTTEALTDQ